MASTVAHRHFVHAKLQQLLKLLEPTTAKSAIVSPFYATVFALDGEFARA
jgi:hypothetical protein